jgi:ATP-dependent RNA helicase DDX47/RRP3
MGAREQVPASLRESMISVRSERKEATLAALIEECAELQILVFAGACRIAEIVADTLKNLRFHAGCAHGRMEQPARMAEIAQFDRCELKILVATNVAARGLDLPNVDMVVNYDVPESPKEYIHRAGRAGRSGRAGFAVTFVTRGDLEKYMKLEKFLKRKLDQRQVREERVTH